MHSVAAVAPKKLKHNRTGNRKAIKFTLVRIKANNYFIIIILLSMVAKHCSVEQEDREKNESDVSSPVKRPSALWVSNFFNVAMSY